MEAVWCVLTLLALLSQSQSANPGVKVKLTQKGLEYGRQIGMATLQSKLKSIKVPDMSGTEKVSPIGKVKYSLTGIQIVSLGLPSSTLGLVPSTGVSLSIKNAFINLHGNWRVKYLRFISDSGSFDLAVSGLTITTQVIVQSDETGRPIVSSANCAANIGSAKIKFHGGASFSASLPQGIESSLDALKKTWLYNLFGSFIDKAFRKALEKKICPLLDDAVSEINPHLKTLNVLAPVDKFAEIEYSLVASPVVSKDFIEFDLKGEFYNIGKHQEPPFAATPFSLPAQSSSMLYIGLSSFTVNSAGFVYNNAGVLNINLTDDMIPKTSPFRLNTTAFGVFVPEVAKRFPNLLMKLLVQSAQAPNITFDPDRATLHAMGTVTAYAIETNGTLAPLFVLNLDASVSAQAYITGVSLAGNMTLNNITITLGKTYVGPFQVQTLENILLMVLKMAVIPQVNARLQQGFPLPALGKMDLVNPQLHILKDYMLIGTDVHFAALTPRDFKSHV